MGLLLRRHHDGTAGVTTAADVTGDDGPPAKSAPKAEWEAYAAARGFLDDPAELTKADLIERFGDD